MELLLLSVLCITHLHTLIKLKRLRKDMVDEIKEVERMTNWELNSQIKDLHDIKAFVRTFDKEFMEIHAALSDLADSAKTAEEATKSISTNVVKLAGIESVSIADSAELITSITLKLEMMSQDVVNSAKTLSGIKSQLLSLSEKFTVGDAEILQRSLHDFLLRAGKTKKTEHLRRAIGSTVKALQPFVEQEILEGMKENLPKDS